MDGVLPTRLARKPRADSIRNRERVLAAARAVFASSGAAGSLEAVARHAGVGVGTLYRHFPTRQSLFEAVYRREVEQLVELAAQLGAELPPLEALRRWMHANVEFVATKKGMSAALAVVALVAMPDRAGRMRRVRAGNTACEGFGRTGCGNGLVSLAPTWLQP